MKVWQRLKVLQLEQMDFRDSRLPPGTYETMIAQAAATHARLQGNKSKTGSRSGSRGMPLEFTPGMRDGAYILLISDLHNFLLIFTSL